MDSGTLIFVLLILILLFFLFREVLCWYWKINRSVELQEQILEELRKINEYKDVPTKSSIEIDSLVVDLKTERQMRVREITPEGRFVCYSGFVDIGTFSPDEVMNFNDWTQKQKNQ